MPILDEVKWIVRSFPKISTLGLMLTRALRRRRDARMPNKLVRLPNESIWPPNYPFKSPSWLRAGCSQAAQVDSPSYSDPQAWLSGPQYESRFLLSCSLNNAQVGIHTRSKYSCGVALSCEIACIRSSRIKAIGRRSG